MNRFAFLIILLLSCAMPRISHAEGPTLPETLAYMKTAIEHAGGFFPAVEGRGAMTVSYSVTIDGNTLRICITVTANGVSVGNKIFNPRRAKLEDFEAADFMGINEVTLGPKEAPLNDKYVPIIFCQSDAEARKIANAARHAASLSGVKKDPFAD